MSNHSVCPSACLFVHLSVHLQFFCGRSCGQGIQVTLTWNFGSVTYDLGPVTLTLRFLCPLLCPRHAICACGPPLRDRCAWAWKFGLVNIDHGSVTLTLRSLWLLLCPSYYCHPSQFIPVDCPCGSSTYHPIAQALASEYPWNPPASHCRDPAGQ